MTKYQGPHIPSDAAKQVATIDQLMAQAQKLKAEVARLEGERDDARLWCDHLRADLLEANGELRELDLALIRSKAWARAWKRAARIHHKRHKEATMQIAYMSRRHAETGE